MGRGAGGGLPSAEIVRNRGTQRLPQVFLFEHQKEDPGRGEFQRFWISARLQVKTLLKGKWEGKEQRKLKG